MLNNWRIATLLRSSLSFLKGGWRGGRAIVILSRLAFQSALSRSGPSGADCAHHRFLERLLDFVSLVRLSLAFLPLHREPITGKKTKQNVYYAKD